MLKMMWHNDLEHCSWKCKLSTLFEKQRWKYGFEAMIISVSFLVNDHYPYHMYSKTMLDIK